MFSFAPRPVAVLCTFICSYSHLCIRYMYMKMCWFYFIILRFLFDLRAFMYSAYIEVDIDLIWSDCLMKKKLFKFSLFSYPLIFYTCMSLIFRPMIFISQQKNKMKIFLLTTFAFIFISFSIKFVFHFLNLAPPHHMINLRVQKIKKKLEQICW